MADKKYQRLFEIAKQTHTLHGIQQLLDWDQETFMPEGAAHFRAEQLKVLSGIIHKQRTGKKFAAALSQVVDLASGKPIAELNELQQAAVKEWRRDYLIEKALPQKFVEEFTFLTSTSMNVWREARQENNFKKFLPFLEKIIQKVRKKADLIGYKEHPYDALLDLFEPGVPTSLVTQVFNGLKAVNGRLLKKIAPIQTDDSFLFDDYPKETQLSFSKEILTAMGYDFHHGRLDLSTHPFSTSFHPTDSRITTRIQENNIFSCLATVLHEGGHSLYEMGLPQEHYGSPLGEAVSLGIHESQSRWWETRIGLSRPFWKYLLPKLKQIAPSTTFQEVDFETFYKAINKVEPSFIRVEADEVTYPLHVILRFELEKALVEGSLKVKEVPEAWNHKMEELLGICPKTDTEGCLQDVHWSMGAIGYFPTYALGNIYAAQFFNAFAKEFPTWESRVEQGELLFIKDWLQRNIFCHGRRWRSIELIERVSGQSFSEKDYASYLEDKYLALYPT